MPRSTPKTSNRSHKRHPLAQSHSNNTTPRRGAAAVTPPPTPPSPRTRTRTKATTAGDDENVKNEDGEEDYGNGLDHEKELEAWQEFAADHYEMVEQLPLELHRNFRLLRELDEICHAQQEKLQTLVRDYVGQRLDLVRPPTPEAEVTDIHPVALDPTAPDLSQTDFRQSELRIDAQHESPEENLVRNGDAMDVDPGDGGALDGQSANVSSEIHSNFYTETLIDIHMDVPTPADDVTAVEEAAELALAGPADHTDAADTVEATEAVEAIDSVHTIEGAETIDAVNTVEATVADANGIMSSVPIAMDIVTEDTTLTHEREPVVNGKNAQAGSSPARGQSSVAPTLVPIVAGPSRRPRAAGLPRALLPGISRLAREAVRNGEEKVAIAIGAYNAIDRHIRALDSALSAQETSLLLGLRPSTLPSASVDTSLGQTGGEARGVGGSGPGAGSAEQEEDVVIGLTGSRRDRQRKKKKAAVAATAGGAADGTGAPTLGANLTGGGTKVPFDIEADPNEPRYCSCNQVSYGEMIGCENEDCPFEWFHLGCVGMDSPPTGKWWCDTCRAKSAGAGGTGGGGGVASTGGGHKASHKASHKSTSHKRKR